MFTEFPLNQEVMASVFHLLYNTVHKWLFNITDLQAQFSSIVFQLHKVVYIIIKLAFTETSLQQVLNLGSIVIMKLSSKLLFRGGGGDASVYDGFLYNVYNLKWDDSAHMEL